MWKKLFRSCGLWVIWCFLLSAVNPHQAYDLHQETKKKTTTSSTVGLNSENLNLSGPFTVSLQYSHLFGYLLKINYAQPFSLGNAMALDLEGGQKEYRLNATLAHAFNPQKCLKISVEHLVQRKNFDFLAGSIDRRVRQNAFGATYEYLIPHGRIHDVYVNAFYSQAQSQNLTALPIPGHEEIINLRHIAGGTDKSVNSGIHVRPSASNQLGVELNYDQIQYRTIYEGNRYDQMGFGATFSFDQLLSKRTKLTLLVKQRMLEHDYRIGFHRLLESAPGTQLEIGLTGERLVSSDGLPDGWQLGADIAYSWGGSRMVSPTTYSFAEASPRENLVRWSSQPAVYMSQVLAIKDETTKAKTPEKNLSGIGQFRYPTHNPKFQPVVVSVASGQVFQGQWKALANDDPGNGMFYDVDSGFNSLQFNVDELNQELDSSNSGLSASMKRIGGNAERYLYLVINGIVKTAEQKKYNLIIRAQNLRNKPNYTEPPEVQYITIQVVGKQADPEILNIQPQLFNFEQFNVKHILATIKAGTSTIRKAGDIQVTVDGKPLSNTGLSLVLDPDRDIQPGEQATLSLGGTSRLETYTTLNGLIEVSPQGGKSVTHTFTFDSRGRPQVIQGSAGEHDAFPGQSWTTHINLDDAFQNTTPDAPGNMNYEVNAATTSSGVHGTIQDNILKTVSVDPGLSAGNYFLRIHAQNKQDALKMQHWSQNDTTYTIHIKAHQLVNISCPHSVTINPTIQQATGEVEDTKTGRKYIFTTQSGTVSDPTYQEAYVSVAYYYPTARRMECQIYYKTRDERGQEIIVDTPGTFTATVPHNGEVFDPNHIGFTGEPDRNYCNNQSHDPNKFCDFQYDWIQG